MTVEVLTYMAADSNREQRIAFALVAQCAPFLKGMRTASVLNIEKGWVRDLYRMINTTDISCRILAVKKESCLALFYREDEDGEPLRAVTRLSARMNRYAKGEIPFPHEMGVFLGYPLEDVKGFIQNGGRGSLFTGYWKVYHDPERARLTFLAYDKAKDSAVNEFLTGKNIREIARMSA